MTKSRSRWFDSLRGSPSRGITAVIPDAIQRGIRRLRWGPLLGVVVLALALWGCAGKSPTITLTPAATASTVTPVPVTGDEPAIAQAASQIATAILTVDYRDLAVWKTRLLALSDDDGKKFWELNLTNGMLRDVPAKQTTTESVQIERVSVLQQKAKGDLRGALVAVTGQVTYRQGPASRTDAFLQQMVLSSVAGGPWRFVAFIQP